MASEDRPGGGAPGFARGVTRPDPDDGERGTRGVVACLVKRQDGTIRLVIDDARRRPDGSWEPHGIFTSRDYPAAPLLDLKVDPQELESLGFSVVARLVAAGQVYGEGS
jgi:hypothetical protein